MQRRCLLEINYDLFFCGGDVGVYEMKELLFFIQLFVFIILYHAHGHTLFFY